MDKENLLNPISTRELERRWGLIRGAMRERRVDALVMQSCNEHMGGYVRWFTDFPATNGYPRSVLFPIDELMTVVEQGPMGEQQIVAADDYVHRGVGKRIFNPSYCTVHYTRHFNAEQMVAAIRAGRFKTVGLVGTAAMYYDFCDHVKKSLDGEVRFVDLTDVVDLYKAQKSDEEIARIRRTAKMQDQVMSTVAQGIKPGMKDFEITALAQYTSNLLGSEQGTYNGASMPLGKPSYWHFHRHEQGREMRQGDHLTLLVENNGAGGFYTELERIFVLGKAPQELAEGFEFMKEAQQHTLQYLRPGNSFKEVFGEHDAFMKKRGLPPEKRMYAHGQGYDLVERPLIRDDETMTVARNMNIAVHPSFSTERMFAAICDNFLVAGDGAPERLHQTPQKIFEILD